jgi:hypothetical protein
MISLTCANLACNKVFTVSPSRINRSKYCSRKCYVRGKIILICANPECRNSFQVFPGNVYAKYCCKLCWAPATLAERFWRKVSCGGPDDCWEWQGSRDTNGYGSLRVPDFKRIIHATRVSWFLAYGVWPTADMQCCHHCDNPPCCNPAHLFLGTQSDNMQDMSSKERHPRSKLTVQQATEMLALHTTGIWTQRALAQRYGISESSMSARILNARKKHS